jgi:hypothetical protein
MIRFVCPNDPAFHVEIAACEGLFKTFFDGPSVLLDNVSEEDFCVGS